MRKRKMIFCAGCANLFILGGTNPPMCVATAAFVEGPLRQKIDVKGIVSAIRRNIHNDCEYRSIVSLRAYELKRWLLWRLNDASKKQIGEVDLRDYSINKEYDRKNAVLCPGTDEEESAGEERQVEIDQESIDTEEYDRKRKAVRDTDKEESAGEKESYSETGEDENVFSDGGVDDYDESGTSGEVGSKGV